MISLLKQALSPAKNRPSAAVFPEGRYEKSPGWTVPLSATKGKGEPWESVRQKFPHLGGVRRPHRLARIPAHAIAMGGGSRRLSARPGCANSAFALKIIPDS